MSELLTFSVIIPFFNRWNELQLCLDALEKQSLSSNEFEIIVVNNASTIEMPVDMKMPENSRIEYEPQPGSYAARNHGAKFATGKFLAFTDSDCIPDQDWLKNAKTLFENSGCDSIGGEIEIFRADDGNKHAYIYEKYYAFKQKEWVPKGHSCTANHLVTRSVFEKVKGFDTSLKSGGDWEFSSRCVKKGYEMKYGGNVVVRHPARRNIKAMLKKHFRHICWGSYITRKKYNCGQFRVMMSALKGGLLNLLKKRTNVENMHHRGIIFYIDFMKLSMQFGVNMLLLFRIIDPLKVRQ